MESITKELLEELSSYGNELQCVKDTMASVQHSDTLVISNLENGQTTEDLVEPLQHMFTLSKEKPYCDVQYVQKPRNAMNINIEESFNGINVYDLKTFLRAITPSQQKLIERVEELCNMYPEYIGLVQKLHLLNTGCQRSICQGRIVAGCKLTKPKDSTITFAIAHPPFVYELKELLDHEDETYLMTYLVHLKQYLDNPIPNDSCLFCLTYDLYCTDSSEVNNFRLFFLEDVNLTFSNSETLDMLYDTEISDFSKADKCLLFDDILNKVQIIRIGHGKDTRLIIRFEDKGQVTLYF